MSKISNAFSKICFWWIIIASHVDGDEHFTPVLKQHANKHTRTQSSLDYQRYRCHQKCHRLGFLAYTGDCKFPTPTECVRTLLMYERQNTSNSYAIATFGWWTFSRNENNLVFDFCCFVFIEDMLPLVLMPLSLLLRLLLLFLPLLLSPPSTPLSSWPPLSSAASFLHSVVCNLRF